MLASIVARNARYDSRRESNTFHSMESPKAVCDVRKSMTKRVTNPPDAKALMTSARSFGNYDLARALADLLDNSISAGARSIEITCSYGAGDPEIRVRDDGEGMSAEELRLAMRPASVNPDEERSADDLGRFGWGMKSASFSQCKLLTVVSKKQGHYSAAAWDLDDIDGWSMASYSGIEAENLLDEAISGMTGTELIWQKCDRLSEGSSLTQDQFNDIIAHAHARLSLVFHRFISGKSGARKISILLNGTPLVGFDPFHSGHSATQAFPAEAIPVTDGTKVVMKAYTLPLMDAVGPKHPEDGEPVRASTSPLRTDEPCRGRCACGKTGRRRSGDERSRTIGRGPHAPPAAARFPRSIPCTWTESEGGRS